MARPETGEAELAALGRVLASGWLGMGRETFAFEEALRNLLGREAIAVSSGTAALHLALEAFGVGPGDEVILPSLTFAAGVQAVLSAGATPVFCEVREDDLLLDLDDVRSRLTARTRAVMPVHYCGQACDMDGLLRMARDHGFRVVEDAAHAFGSRYRGRMIGSFGDVTCFSFDPIKVVTCGEGGAILVEDPERAEELRRKRLLGIDRDTWKRYQNTRSWAYEVTTAGYRYHMPDFCAALGLAQLPKLEEFIQRRRAICRRYDAAFHRLPSVRPLHVDYRETAPFTYIVRVRGGRRDAFMDCLKERGVDTGIHYIPNHAQPYFKQFARGPLPRTEALGQQIVTLPLFSGMTDEEAETVIHAVTGFDRPCPP